MSAARGRRQPGYGVHRLGEPVDVVRGGEVMKAPWPVVEVLLSWVMPV